jgi:predicted nuclease of predicted toxin-antitoxin system
MKLLLDSCVSNKVRDVLQNAGHNTIWAGDWEKDPGDEEILATAHTEGRVLITLDKDFGELAIVREIPHSGILRLVNLSLKQQAANCIQVLEKYSDELQAGAIVTAEAGRVRIRLPE